MPHFVTQEPDPAGIFSLPSGRMSSFPNTGNRNDPSWSQKGLWDCLCYYYSVWKPSGLLPLRSHSPYQRTHLSSSPTHPSSNSTLSKLSTGPHPSSQHSSDVPVVAMPSLSGPGGGGQCPLLVSSALLRLKVPATLLQLLFPEHQSPLLHLYSQLTSFSSYRFFNKFGFYILTGP